MQVSQALLGPGGELTKLPDPDSPGMKTEHPTGQGPYRPIHAQDGGRELCIFSDYSRNRKSFTCALKLCNCVCVCGGVNHITWRTCVQVWRHGLKTILSAVILNTRADFALQQI